MRIQTLLVLATLLMAACADEPAPPAAQLEAGLITPGTWIVNGSPDHILAWMHNKGDRPVDVDWTMRFSNGTAIPSTWQLRSADARATLQPNGAKVRVDGQMTYPDWAWTLFTITVPDGTPAANHSMVLDTGKSQHAFSLRITPERTRVSHAGDEVEVRYDGKFHSTGQRFDDGEFPTELGSGQTVPGFDYGLMGLAVGEDATLVLPPAIGYGYDQTHPGYTKFNGQTLRFEVRILGFL